MTSAVTSDVMSDVTSTCHLVIALYLIVLDVDVIVVISRRVMYVCFLLSAHFVVRKLFFTLPRRQCNLSCSHQDNLPSGVISPQDLSLITEDSLHVVVIIHHDNLPSVVSTSRDNLSLVVNTC